MIKGIINTLKGLVYYLFYNTQYFPDLFIKEVDVNRHGHQVQTIGTEWYLLFSIFH